MVQPKVRIARVAQVRSDSMRAGVAFSACQHERPAVLGIVLAFPSGNTPAKASLQEAVPGSCLLLTASREAAEAA
eukprot:CAMPEP_0171064534 /NCGR_PEP_ID=MMETSP0766_2-20121228/6346_1 /TAXON_ID=439317 /ORGANISM="Gambierdiscus australes, Strain CAWD 149" /LENGTH=74 /DNA_ID=CAMNT_0011520577 /DNA_START=23 /DNA_END=244 /DNA_ORIENTATION=+